MDEVSDKDKTIPGAKKHCHVVTFTKQQQRCFSEESMMQIATTGVIEPTRSKLIRNKRYTMD